MPDDFFRESIKRELLTAVDLNCLRLCVNAAKALTADFWFHVNLFPSTILETPEKELLSIFPRDIKKWKFCIEIVEQEKISDVDRLDERLRKLRKSGIKLAIDDVGFGASSLESLIVLEPDILKIDRRYVTGVSGDPERRRHLERLIEIAKVLDAELVAEGIETKSDLKLMNETGVRYGQGFLWGDPK